MGKKGKGSGAEFWDGLQGWRAVDVGDALLLGSEEYGFCGLEEISASAVGDLMIPAGGPVAAAEEPAGEAQQQQEGKGTQKGQKRKQPGAASGSAEPAVAEQAAGEGKKGKNKKQPKQAAQQGEAGGGAEQPAAAADGEQLAAAEDVAALKKQLAVLSAENRALKRQQKKEARTEKRAAAEAKRKGEKAARRAAAGEAAATVAAAKAAAASRVDVSAWKDMELHLDILKAIAALGFGAPTQVQAECLPAAVRDRRDVIGAAQTGSGKTLAFGLPIMQLLLAERARHAQQELQELQEQQQQGCGGDGEQPAAAQQELPPSPLRALILAPTRELALQVCEHLQAVGKSCGVWVVPIVGGISQLKQERLLSKHPEIVVATPGRLWDLMREGQPHVTNLSRLSFLVIDEADRMVQQGHYGELSSILGAIPTHQALAEPEAPLPEPEPEQREPKRKIGADGEEEAEEEEEEGGSGSEREEDGSGGDEEQQEQEAADAQQQQEEEEEEEQAVRPRPHRMQTFVFSATLTLPASLRRRLRKGGGGASGSSDLDVLMDNIPFRGKPKIVDLTSDRKLADRIEEACIECGEAERDEALYCLLAKHPGRTIVFVNAISSVRRLGAILKLLGLPAQALHAGMQQKQRLKALDRFKAEPNAVLVATDVAARGLDIKGVRCVVHYQLPASVDIYVHRSGRTARAEEEGIAIALVTPKESPRFQALLKAMKREEPPQFPLDTSLLPAVHKRVRLAVRLDELERKQKKSSAEKSWMQQHAEQLGIELSDEESDEVEGRRQGKKAKREKGGKRGPEDAESAADIRAQLAALLAEPLQPSFSRKWFTGGAAAAVAATVDPSAAPAAGGKAGKRQRKAAGEEPAAAPEPKTQQTVNAAVAFAQQRTDSRSAAAAAAAAKQRGGKQQPGQQQAQQPGQQQPGTKTKPGKGGKKCKGVDPRAAALQAALNKALAKKQLKKAGGGSGGGGARGMLVIPTALGRDVVGPDALQTLRAKLGR
ncbi:DEAD-box ATP-dependent RNA helicase 13 [Micractinium conductrix]|uniref:ATP-dependent RNA helicase n=1 Tax=Micractinium conductrix TaxID=554055 RepID=A0A2P6VSA2_9CHLO|nr:DEAD-box ATP-dependent RNA helicase 13 [Micractinium conductrix]|eukprot:PSC76969.1 DEAD-box ATP-dependent RNA helicase 13 [Micractinium conductrix]